MKKFAPFLALVLLANLLSPILVTQPVTAWSTDSSVNTPVCTAKWGQGTLGLATVGDGAGGAIIAWADGRRGGRGDIYAQRLDPNGEPQWNKDGVPVCTESGDRYGVFMADDGAGGAVIAWMDMRAGPSIYAQKLDSTGHARWAPGGVAVCVSSGYQSDIVIAGDGSGGAILAWSDSRSGDGPIWGIYAQRIDSTGEARWTADGVAVCPAGQDQYQADIVSDGSGGAVITWRDYAGGKNDIFAQRLDSDGAQQWAQDGVAVCTAPGAQMSPTTVADAPGGFIVSWLDSRNSHDNIYAQRMDSGGSIQWAQDGVAICTAAIDPENMVIAGDGSGGAIIVWQESRNGNHDVYAQRVDNAGVVRWPGDGLPVAVRAGEQFAPAVVSNGSGGAVVVWEDVSDTDEPIDIHGERFLYTLSKYGGDVYAYQVDSAGTAQSEEQTVPVSTARNGQGTPVVASDGSGGVICAWIDCRNDQQGDVYAQRITGAGALGPPSIGVGTPSWVWIAVAAGVVAVAVATLIIWRRLTTAKRLPGNTQQPE
jgi:hypothetical protein